MLRSKLILPPSLLIDFENVCVQRGGRLGLQGIGLTVKVGEHVAILGPNGSGKSAWSATI